MEVGRCPRCGGLVKTVNKKISSCRDCFWVGRGKDVKVVKIEDGSSE